MRFKGAFFCLAVLVPALGWSEPYLAAWKGVNCNACHMNQTGGWLRNDFGKNYGNQLATIDWQGLENAAQSAARAAAPRVAIGFDLHEAYVGTFYPKPVTNVNGFLSGSAGSNQFPNAGRQALEIGVNANENVAGVLTYRLDDNQTREMYGLIKNLPEGGYLKFGKFTVPYGLELADDNSLVRSGLGFTFDNAPSEGIEAGIYPGPAFVN